MLAKKDNVKYLLCCNVTAQSRLASAKPQQQLTDYHSSKYETRPVRFYCYFADSSSAMCMLMLLSCYICLPGFELSWMYLSSLILSRVIAAIQSAPLMLSTSSYMSVLRVALCICSLSGLFCSCRDSFPSVCSGSSHLECASR